MIIIKLGILNMNFHYLNWDLVGWKSCFNTLIHEVFHILMFSSFLYKYYVDEAGTQLGINNVYRLKPGTTDTYQFILPKIVSYAKSFYGCDTIDAVDLENDDEGEPLGSHWEDALFRDENMSPIDRVNKDISDFTLILAESSGWYMVDHTKIGPYAFGKSKGCNFLKNSCTNSPLFSEYCSTLNDLGCQEDYTSFGSCSKNTFSRSCQTMDGGSAYMCNYAINKNNCPFCTSAAGQGGSVSGGSRCFKSDLRSNTYAGSYYAASCYQSECFTENNIKKIKITIGNTDKICSADQEVITVTGYAGGLTCPKIQDFCSYLDNRCPQDCLEGGGLCLIDKTCLYMDGQGICSSNCVSCKSSTYCFVCKPGYYINYDGSEDKTVCKKCVGTCPRCPDNYIWDNNSQKCGKCHSTCLTCKGTQDSDCITCQPTYTFYNSKCINCNTLGPKCIECSGDSCTKCMPGYTVSNKQCIQMMFPPSDPSPNFSGPGQIYHPQTGKCLAHKLAVGTAVGASPDYNVELVDCEGVSFEGYKKTVWKFSRSIQKVGANSFLPSDINDSEDQALLSAKVFIRPFSNNYAPNDANAYYFLTSSTVNNVESLKLMLAVVGGTKEVLWDVTYKKSVANSSPVFFSKYLLFNCLFILNKGGSVTFNDAATLEHTQVSLQSGNQVKMKALQSSFSLVLEQSETISATTPVYSSFFIFKKVDYAEGDGSLLKNTFVWNKEPLISQLSDQNELIDRISIVLRLDPSSATSKQSGIHNDGVFFIQGANLGFNLSSICSNKYNNNNSAGISFDFYNNYQADGLPFSRPLSEESVTVAVKITISPIQLVACGFEQVVDASEATQFKGRVGYVSSASRSGWFWAITVSLNNQLMAQNTYIDNPDSHYWFFDGSQDVYPPSFGRLLVFRSLSTSPTAVLIDKNVQMEENAEIMVKDPLFFQIRLENTLDNYIITNLKVFLFRTQVPSLGGVELVVKELEKSNNYVNFTVAIDKIPNGEYKILAQYYLTASVTNAKRILLEENRRIDFVNEGSSAANIRIVDNYGFALAVWSLAGILIGVLLA